MPKPVGGRGRKAPYKTTTVRIPVDIKQQVDLLVAQFRGDCLNVVNDENIKLKKPIQIIQRYKLKLKSENENSAEVDRLITDLELELNQTS